MIVLLCPLLRLRGLLVDQVVVEELRVAHVHQGAVRVSLGDGGVVRIHRLARTIRILQCNCIYCVSKKSGLILKRDLLYKKRQAILDSIAKYNII